LHEEGDFYGVHPPSIKLEIIPKDKIGRIQEGGKTLGGPYSGAMIEKKIVRRYIRESRKKTYG